MLGSHLEGPFLNPEQAGAQPVDHLRKPDPALLEEMLAAAGGTLRIMTLAPELPGALGLVERLVDAGVVASMGHSDATYRKAMAAAIAERLRYLDHCAVVGRGFCYGTAFEVALKLAELTYVVAQPFSSADFRHGPMAVVDPGFCVILLAPKGKVLADVRELQKTLNQRQAEVIAISDSRQVLAGATRGLALPGPQPEWLAPLTCVIPGQLLAMHLCHAKGLPLDRPRGLKKVTRTR